MTEEEKKAIERIYKMDIMDENCIGVECLDEEDNRSIRILVNLIEKLQKENEELNKEVLHYKANVHRLSRGIDVIPKQKIRDNMKKYEWALNSYDSSIADYRHSQNIGKYFGLQELLEGEKNK